MRHDPLAKNIYFDILEFKKSIQQFLIDINSVQH